MVNFPALAHVALTVSDLRTSAAWYQRLIGAEPILDEDTGLFHHIIFALGNGTMLGLHAFPPDTASTDQGWARFDERRVGLDHVAFACADRAELENWRKRLNDLGIEHGEIVDAHYGSGLALRDPDNIQLEFFAPIPELIH
ncbi:VOC family protein [Streptomyces hirsutus]|uniref:VOC family protein n=1 Tax=Streptomyces hirsutus TaxID=35620 RepID=UPI0033AAD60B